MNGLTAVTISSAKNQGVMGRKSLEQAFEHIERVFAGLNYSHVQHHFTCAAEDAGALPQAFLGRKDDGGGINSQRYHPDFFPPELGRAK